MKHTEETKNKIRNSNYHKHLFNDKNPFFGKTHSKETIERIKNHPNYINRKTRNGMKHTEETKKKMSKKRKSSSKDWNHCYRKDVKYEGPDRVKIIGWCGLNDGIPDDIATIWFNECLICGWNEAKCDLHHKKPKKLGGLTELDNIMVLCPNCHRLEHIRWNKENPDKCKQIYKR